MDCHIKKYALLAPRLLLVAVVFLFVTPRMAQCQNETIRKSARVESTGQASLVTVNPEGEESDSLLVQDTALQERVKALRKGDLITLTFSTNEDGQNVLKAFTVDTTTTPKQVRVIVLIVSAIGLLGLYWLFARAPLKTIIIGDDNR